MDRYTSMMIRAGAMIPEARWFLIAWDWSESMAANADRIQARNMLGAASRAQAATWVNVLMRRFWKGSVPVGAALTSVAKHPAAADVWLKPLLYFFTAQADYTLRDLVLSVVQPRYRTPLHTLTIEQEFYSQASTWSATGQTARPWSSDTARRVSRSAVSALRDFGVLRRPGDKISPPVLPLPAFSLIAFWLHEQASSGMRLLTNPEWGLFLLDAADVEAKLLEAHRCKLLEYQAAGSTVRVDFPAATLPQYARLMAARIEAETPVP